MEYCPNLDENGVEYLESSIWRKVVVVLMEILVDVLLSPEPSADQDAISIIRREQVSKPEQPFRSPKIIRSKRSRPDKETMGMVFS